MFVEPYEVALPGDVKFSSSVNPPNDVDAQVGEASLPEGLPDAAGHDAAPRPDQPATLRTVLEGLGTEVIQVLVAPHGLDVAVTCPVIDDPVERAFVERGDIVLAVGTPAIRHTAVSLVASAGAAGAAAIVFKGAEQATAPLIDAARHAGVAVIALVPDMSWTQAYTLLRTVTAVGSSLGGNAEGRAVGDLFHLANAIAAMVGGATTIEDRDSNVLAYSSLDERIDEARRQTILGQRVPEAWRKRLKEDGFFQRLWREEGPIRLHYPDTDPPLQPRLAIAVRAGGEVFGSIWVAEGDRPLGPEAYAALREAAGIAALHLIRARSSEDVERERRSALLRSVLERITRAELVAESLDVDADSFVTVLAFRLALGEPEDVAVRSRRATDLIALSCESYRRRAACVAIGATVYVVIPDTAAPDRSRLAALAADIVERLSGSLRVAVTVGIGSTVRGLARLPSSRNEADHVLRVVDEAGVVRAIEDVRSLTILARLRDFAKQEPGVLEGKLDRLAAFDHSRQTAHLATLRAYLDAFGDVATAATAVGVHQNTFRYRLRRIVEIARLDLDDPVERLITHLQLHIRDDLS